MENKKDHLNSKTNAIKSLKKILLAFGILLIFLDFFLHRHSYFSDSGLTSIDGSFGFFAWMPFLGCFVLLILSILFKSMFHVNEDYYND